MSTGTTGAPRGGPYAPHGFFTLRDGTRIPRGPWVPMGSYGLPPTPAPTQASSYISVGCVCRVSDRDLEPDFVRSYNEYECDCDGAGCTACLLVEDARKSGLQVCACPTPGCQGVHFHRRLLRYRHIVAQTGPHSSQDVDRAERATIQALLAMFSRLREKYERQPDALYKLHPRLSTPTGDYACYGQDWVYMDYSLYCYIVNGHPPPRNADIRNYFGYDDDDWETDEENDDNPYEEYEEDEYPF